MDEPFYTDALTCKLCLVHCRVEERQKIEKELGCSVDKAKYAVAVYGVWRLQPGVEDGKV